MLKIKRYRSDTGRLELSPRRAEHSSRNEGTAPEQAWDEPPRPCSRGLRRTHTEHPAVRHNEPNLLIKHWHRRGISHSSLHSVVRAEARGDALQPGRPLPTAAALGCCAASTSLSRGLLQQPLGWEHLAVRALQQVLLFCPWVLFAQPIAEDWAAKLRSRCYENAEHLRAE